MSDQDDEAIVETVEDPYYSDSPPKGPSTTMERIIEKGSDLVVSPWFILGFLALSYYLYIRYIRKWIHNWRTRREEAKQIASMKKNPDLWKSRLEAMEKARSRLQAEHERAAVAHAAKRAELEEEKRLKKVEEWEILKKGGSLKGKKASDSKKKNYFPLMGSGDGQACYRSNRRSGSGKGG